MQRQLSAPRGESQEKMDYRPTGHTEILLLPLWAGYVVYDDRIVREQVVLFDDSGTGFALRFDEPKLFRHDDILLRKTYFLLWVLVMITALNIILCRVH